FDRPADEKALGALLKLPAMRGLTESLLDLSPTEWRTVLARLRRARLLAAENLEGNGTAVFSCHLRLPGRFISRCVARSLHSANSARKCLLRCQRPRSRRSFALGFSSFLRTRTVGVAGANGCRRTESHRGRG